MNFELTLSLNCKVSLHRKTRHSIDSSAISSNNCVHKNTTIASTSLKFGLSFKRRKHNHRRRMAIAFYVPPEYGPPQAQQAQGGGAAAPAPDNNNNDPVIVDIQHFAQDANNNNVAGNPNEMMVPQDNNPVNDRLVGYLTQFVQEVLGVFATSSRRRGNNNQSARDNQDRVPRNQSRRRVAQDNQSGASENHEPTLNQQLPSLPFPLPDIVTCHAGLSFRYGSSRPPDLVINTTHDSDDDDDAQELDNSLSNDHPGPQPLSPRSSQYMPPSSESSSMDFEVSLKLEVSVGGKTSLHEQDAPVPAEAINLSVAEQYRVTGRQLREIADNFRVSTQRRSRRRGANNRNRSTFELNLVISVAVPAVAIVGLGLAYLRRR